MCVFAWDVQKEFCSSTVLRVRWQISVQLASNEFHENPFSAYMQTGTYELSGTVGQRVISQKAVTLGFWPDLESAV